MIIQSLAEHDHYFRNLGNIHPAIKDVVIGDSERILSHDRSKLNYPTLWVETPNVKWRLKSPDHAYLSGFFVVLINTQVDNEQRERYVLDQSLNITNDIIATLRDDAYNDLINADADSFSSKPILGYGTDNDFGWRTSYMIGFPIGQCPDYCRANVECPPGAVARFDWENRQDGDFTDLVITPSIYPSLFDHPWSTIEYITQVENEAPVTSTDPPTNLGTGSYLRVILRVSDGKCTIEASAYISNDAGCGSSVPFILNPKDVF
ncbi:MAG: hypothetical protein AAFU67_10680 [Bacteroidota bacterium]